MNKELQGRDTQVLLADIVPLLNDVDEKSRLIGFINNQDDKQEHISTVSTSSLEQSFDSSDEERFIVNEKFKIKNTDQLSNYDIVSDKPVVLKPLPIPETSFERKVEDLQPLNINNRSPPPKQQQRSADVSPRSILSSGSVATAASTTKSKSKRHTGPNSIKFSSPREVDLSADDFSITDDKPPAHRPNALVQSQQQQLQAQRNDQQKQRRLDPKANISNEVLTTNDGYLLPDVTNDDNDVRVVSSKLDTSTAVTVSATEMTPQKKIVIKDIMKLQSTLQDLHLDKYFDDESELYQFKYRDLMETKQELLDKVNELEQGWFLENMILSAVDTTSYIFNGKRKILGMKPNLQGLHFVVKNKLRTRKHLLAEKSRRIQDRIGEDKLLALEIIIATVQHGCKTK